MGKKLPEGMEQEWQYLDSKGRWHNCTGKYAKHALRHGKVVATRHRTVWRFNWTYEGMNDDD